MKANVCTILEKSQVFGIFNVKITKCKIFTFSDIFKFLLLIIVKNQQLDKSCKSHKIMYVQIHDNSAKNRSLQILEFQ